MYFLSGFRNVDICDIASNHPLCVDGLDQFIYECWVSKPDSKALQDRLCLWFSDNENFDLIDAGRSAIQLLDCGRTVIQSRWWDGEKKDFAENIALFLTKTLGD